MKDMMMFAASQQQQDAGVLAATSGFRTTRLVKLYEYCADYTQESLDKRLALRKPIFICPDDVVKMSERTFEPTASCAKASSSPTWVNIHLRNRMHFEVDGTVEELAAKFGIQIA